jgi:hypothetical protein
MIRTEFDFVLPVGYADETGKLQRRGTMRLANAVDEIAPMKDRRVQGNPAYLTILLLSRVITRLGNISKIIPDVIEGLYSKDFAYLQEMYNRINQSGVNTLKTTCPKCSRSFDVNIQPDDESSEEAK